MPEPSGEHLNWVDPDILAYEGENAANLDFELEREFRDFFAIEWQEPQWDFLRERWDKHLNDEDPYGRLLGKTALWNLVQLHKLRWKRNEGQ